MSETPLYRAGLGHIVPPGYIRIGTSITLPAVLERLGFSSEVLCREEGVHPDIFGHPDNTMPYDHFCRFLSRCVRETGRDDLGLLICETTGPSSLGLVGFLLQQAPDVGSALADLVRYLRHSDRGAFTFLNRSKDVVSLGYVIYDGDAPGAAQVYDGAIAIGRNMMKALCGPRWTPTEVWLARPKSASTTRYERFFDAPVRFEAEYSALVFSGFWLDTPLPNADPALRAMLKEQIDLLEREDGGTLSEQVRRLLRTVLLTRRGSLDDVRLGLHMTRKTLSRHLAAEGTTFTKLSDEMRFEVARHLLRNTSMPMSGVTAALDYSEASAFSRAFKQWSGVSPTEWRRQNRPPPPLQA
ncbi:AraC family transcriptional regulator [Chelatococcus asaccharovorans]|uniref:AraC-like DNA-binding protein n=1 Tax=Chelatococcus asaccharovorans TaxID=28210 RepID=A0A2V3TYS7_9HYPH|nr:AraC family transcriptional regulator [Chelatococcus asaccharovorans]MBS7704784.1 AraC family transcriptional regulator [Chelatococcus asaccharovorans]PXW54682.1 AraC-like DNA-binding protein [Chelatococcus asaccharovorans]